MTVTDGILALAAIVGLALYLAVLIWYVPQPALIVVCVVTVLMAAFDFVREFRQHRSENRR